MKAYSFRALLACVICISFFMGMPAQAKLYKWKDENGQIHYGDKIPAKYADKERKELNEQGTVVKKIDRAKTDDEIKEKI